MWDAYCFADGSGEGLANGKNWWHSEEGGVILQQSVRVAFSDLKISQLGRGEATGAKQGALGCEPF
jgi:hypothetical protein